MLWQLLGKGWIQSLLALHSVVFVFHTELLIWNIRWLLKAFVIVGYYPPISESLFCRAWEVCKQYEQGNKENQGQQQSVNSDFYELPTKLHKEQGASHARVKCLNVCCFFFPLLPSLSTIHSAAEKGIPQSLSWVGVLQREMEHGSAFPLWDTSQCWMLFFIMVPKTAAKSMPFSTCFCLFQIKR